MLHRLTLRWWCRVALWWRSVVAATDPLLLMGGHLVANIAGQCLLGLSCDAQTWRRLCFCELQWWENAEEWANSEGERDREREREMILKMSTALCVHCGS